MTWECMKCGGKYEDAIDHCETCNIGKEYAINMVVKLKTCCPECFHPHRPKKFCHVFCQGAGDDLGDDEDSLGKKKKVSV